MPQQTAVEWLVKEIESLITIETFQRWKVLKEQAKQKEREQHWQTWMDSTHKYSFEIYFRDKYNN